MRKKTALVVGAGGFIGSHMVKRLKEENYFVRGVDVKFPDFSRSVADEFHLEDVTKLPLKHFMFKGGFDEVYQLAADMGGAGYIFSGDNDSDILTNSMGINLTCAQAAVLTGVKKFFFSSSACVYPEELQNVHDVSLKETDAYPAHPDSIYGWEKIVSEQLYKSFERNFGLSARIARFHNIYGPEGTYVGGKEKAPAALCRKVAQAKEGDAIEVWGDGEQTRSFLYIDECIEGVRRFMQPDVWVNAPVLNIGSDEMVSINELAAMIIRISGKQVFIKNIESNTIGVQGRNSDNTFIREVLNWSPDYPLEKGIKQTYQWIDKQVNPKLLFNQN